MPRAKSCACNWEYVGESLGAVWFRGKMQTFVAVRPDGSVLGANFRTRARAWLGLVLDARRREGLAGVLLLSTDAPRKPSEVVDLKCYRATVDSFGAGIVRMLRRGLSSGT